MKTIKQYLGKVSITCNGLWDINRAYDRLCLVHDGHFASYISRVQVPTGIALEDESYWQPVANLRDDVKLNLDELEKNIIELTATIQIKLASARLVVENIEERDALTITEVAPGCEVYIKETQQSWILDTIVCSPGVDTYYKEWHLEADSKIDTEEKYELEGTFDTLTADRAICDAYGNIIHDTYITRETVHNFIDSVIDEFLSNWKYEIQEGTITYDMLSQQLKDMFKAGEGAAITNMADEEDLTVKDNQLKFKDRKYIENEFSGKGYKILRKNWMNNINLLEQSMINEKNTIYEVRYLFCLDNTKVTISANSVLYLNGGQFNNGTIVLNETPIRGIYKLSDFGTATIEGSFAKGQLMYVDDKEAMCVWSGTEWINIYGVNFKWAEDNSIDISYDGGKTWNDLTPIFNNQLAIKDIVASVSNIPSDAVIGDIYSIGPTYDESDTEHTKPIYELYIKTSNGNQSLGRYNSINAGIVQELGDSETEVISQNSVSQNIIKDRINNILSIYELDNLEYNISSNYAIRATDGIGISDDTCDIYKYYLGQDKLKNINIIRIIGEFDSNINPYGLYGFYNTINADSLIKNTIYEKTKKVIIDIEIDISNYKDKYLFITKNKNLSSYVISKLINKTDIINNNIKTIKNNINDIDVDINKIKNDIYAHDYNELIGIEKQGYYINQNGETEVSSWKYNKFEISANSIYFISGRNGTGYLGDILDENNDVIEILKYGNSSEYFTNFKITTPNNAKYIRINGRINDIIKCSIDKLTDILNIYTKEEINNIINNDWSNKIIWWCGTSIPEGKDDALGSEENGKSYPQRIGDILNATIYNVALGSSMCRRSTRTGDFINCQQDNLLRALSHTIEEKEYIFNNWNTIKNNIKGLTKDILSDNDKTIMINASFENKLIPYLNGTYPMPDLFVFDHGHNDVKSYYSTEDNVIDTDIEPTINNIPTIFAKDDYMINNNYSNLKKYILEIENINPNDLNSFIASINRNSFIGAMNFLITIILRYNPKAKILIITDYQNKDNYKYAVNAQEKIADSWLFPICKVYKHLGYSQHIIPNTKNYWTSSGTSTDGYTGFDLNMLRIYAKDGIHPHSGGEYSLQNYANVIAKYIRNIM